MKIEIGESLGYSYLRHVKQCWLVQANWKASEHWAKLQADDVLERDFKEMRRRFDHDGSVFKGSRDFGQLLKQAEIDVMGVDRDGGVHAMDVAFHEAGLNYLGGSEKRVLKKMLRTKLILDAYHSAKTERSIYFASPKVNPGVQQPLEEMFDRLREEYPSVHWNLMTNDKFTNDVLIPTVEMAGRVADSSELFARSVKLLELSGLAAGHRSGGVPRIKSPTPEGAGQTSMSKPGTTNQQLQSIVRGLMRTLLEDYPTLLSNEDRRNLMDADYCRESMGLQLGGFALLRRQGEGRVISGRGRYYKEVYAGRYYVTSQWWKDHHYHNASSLLRFVEKMMEGQQDNMAIATLERHRAALQDYLR